MIQYNDEQIATIDAVRAGGSVKVRARAGAGKTTTLVGCAEAFPRRSIYLAFNKAIASEAQGKFPSHVTAKTPHSLAYQAIVNNSVARQKLAGRLTGYQVAKSLHIRPMAPLTAAAIGSLVIDACNRFCTTMDSNVGVHHVYLGDPEKTPAEVLGNTQLKRYIADYAQALWYRMSDLNDPTPMSHNTYLKMWALKNPVLPCDTLYFDEAQDCNPVLLHIAQSQGCQKVWVGDEFQQIYGWNGAINAMDLIQGADERQLTQSFRFGQQIADVANRVIFNHLGAKIGVRGFDRIQSRVRPIRESEADCVISRTNKSAFEGFISSIIASQPARLGGDPDELIGIFEAILALKQGGRPSRSSFALFGSYAELVEHSESEIGADLRPLIKIEQIYGADILIEMVRRGKNATHGTLYTTAHKSKGCEWKNVKLASDFRSKDSPKWNEEEARLLYVATTRAIENLDISECASAIN